MPIDTTDIERLTQILERSGVAAIEIEEEALSLRLVMEVGEPTAPSPDNSVTLKAGMRFGTTH